MRSILRQPTPGLGAGGRGGQSDVPVSHTMSPGRRRDLQASLRREFSLQTQERGLSQMARVVWLVDQLENYVERWVGLCQTSSHAVSPHSDDLFLMVEVGAEAVSEEVRALGSPVVAESWRGFLAALAAARGGCDDTVAQRLSKA